MVIPSPVSRESLCKTRFSSIFYELRLPQWYVLAPFLCYPFSTNYSLQQRLEGNRTIVRYIDSHAGRLANGTGYEVFVLMEYCSGNGLIDFMNTRLREQLTEPEILQIACDIGLGVANMHYLSPPLLHRDLKIENVLISGDGVYKLCDFGSASNILRPPRNSTEFQVLDNDIQSHTTAQYRAPEMVDIARGFPIDEKSDIWAFGVFIYKLCYYTTPFEREGNMAILNARFTFPPKPAYSDRLKRFINVTLSEDPRMRPNVFQCLKELYSMRGMEVPLKDIYTAPTATTWKDAAVPQPIAQASLPVQEQDSSPAESNPFPQRTPEASASSTNPYRNSQTPTSTSSSSLARKTPDVEPEPVSELDDDAEAKYPTIEELSLSLEQQAFNFSPTNASPYTQSNVYTSSFSNLSQGLSVPTVPTVTPAMPISIAPSTTTTAFNSYTSTSGVNNAAGSWNSYQPQVPQPNLSTSYTSPPSVPSSYIDMAWQTPTPRPAMVTPSNPIESRSHTPAAPSYPQVSIAAFSTSSSSSSSEDSTSAIVDSTHTVRSINLNRSSSTASIRRPPSLSQIRKPEETNYFTGQAPQNYDERIQRPRPVSLYVQPSESLLDLNGDVEPVPKRSYSRGAPANEGNLIEPVVTDEKDNLKSLLTGLSEKSKTVMLNNGDLSNADYLKALAEDTTGRSRHSKSPGYAQTMISSSSSSGEDDSYLKARSASRQGKRTSISLKSKINDAFKIFEAPGSRSASGQISRPPRNPEHTNGYMQNRRMSYSTDNLGGYSMQERESSIGSGSNDPETIVRQASFMEAEDASQFERPKQYTLTPTKSALSLGRHNVSSQRSASSNPAYTIQNRIQALINGKSSPPPRTASGYGKYTDDSVRVSPSQASDQRKQYDDPQQQQLQSEAGLYRVKTVSTSAPSAVKKPGLLRSNSGMAIDYSALGRSRHGGEANKDEILVPGNKKISNMKHKSKHIRQLSVISSESSSTDSSAGYDVGSNGNLDGKQAPRLPLKPKHLQSPKRQASDLESQQRFFQQSNGELLLAEQPAAVTNSGGINVTSATTATAAAAKNLMDDRSPGQNGNDDWKEMFNRKYPSLA